MSTNSIVAGVTSFGLRASANAANRGSSMATTPTFFSIVQKG
jgi:hypothetical protein